MEDEGDHDLLVPFTLVGDLQGDVDDVAIGHSGEIVAITDLKDGKGGKLCAVAGTGVTGGRAATNVRRSAAFQTATAGVVTAPILADAATEAVGVIVADPIAEFIPGAVRVALAGISAFIGRGAVLACLALIIGPAAPGTTVVPATNHLLTALVIASAAADTGEPLADLIGFTLVIGVTTPLTAPIFTDFAAGAGFIADTATAPTVVQFFPGQTEALAGACILTAARRSAIGAATAQEQEQEGKAEGASKVYLHHRHSFVVRCTRSRR